MIQSVGEMLARFESALDSKWQPCAKTGKNIHIPSASAHLHVNYSLCGCESKLFGKSNAAFV